MLLGCIREENLDWTQTVCEGVSVRADRWALLGLKFL